MSHLDDELLAAEALGQTDEFSAADRTHLNGCAECQASLRELTEITELARHPEQGAIDQATLASTWSAIQRELSAQPIDVPHPTGDAPRPTGDAPRPRRAAAGEVLDPFGFPDTTDRPTAPVQAAAAAAAADAPGRRRSFVRSTWLLAAAAAVVGVLVGVLATTVVQRNDVQVLGSTSLSALPGHSGTGTAELVVDHGQPQLRLQVEAPDPQSKFRQVWLIDTDGTKMYSLGVLPDNGTGTYALPPELARGLGGFRLVDVSIEPYDGNPAHSHDSQVRGELPA